ncbi:MAG: TonB-dependent receptor [Maricaulis sp.]|uniref:TonB-dependent receptor n=1 Tax=Maricaulis sp. TaxID=1486257 RepID=UPI001B26830A|nr:TonB-dependent receptor [Maricaulis sp.]MBO6796610.1 TonB-dependent receptor [Maricaulis sp.]MDM7985537.1 TonB-dependent receptor [Maricaulis sp.]
MRKSLSMLGTASVLALATAASALAGGVSGRVTDASETIGLNGATIRVVETGQTVTAGRDGEFRIAGLPAGQYTLRISYVGADTRDITVSIPTDSAVATQNIALGDDVSVRENILVIGQRGAINSALSRQRSNDGVITVLSSDAIGQFPDENVAEAARRAVGVNVLNDQGEGRFVSIRGASPNLVSVSVNGVRLTSPEAEDRQVGLDVIDADALSSVVIHKSLLPNMDADGIGGMVEIETDSGLNVDGMRLRGRVAGLFSSLEDEFGMRASANYADNFMDGRLGVAASLSYQERVFGSENMEVDGEWDEEDGIYFPNELELRNYEVTRERTTANLNFDFRATENLNLHLRTTASEFSDQEYRSRMEVKYEDGDFRDDLSSGTLAVFEATDFGIDRDIKDRLETQSIYATDFGGEYFMGDTTIDFGLSYVYSEEEEPNRIDTEFDNGFENSEIFGVDGANPLRPALRFGINTDEQAFYDPSNYGLDKIELTNGISIDREWAGQINVRRDNNWFGVPGYVHAGLRFRNRDKKYDGDLEVWEDDNDVFDLTLADFPRTVDYGLADIGVTGNPFTIRDFFFANQNQLVLDAGDSTIESQVADYNMEEDVFAGYVMGSWDIENLRITGGVRVEQTDVSTFGYQLDEDSGNIEPVTASDDYTDVLPSVLARYEASENVILRAGYYTSIQRPNPNEYAPRIFINDDNEAELGNPSLERLEAQNFDAAIEWYPNNDSVVSLGYFYKDLENVIGEFSTDDPAEYPAFVNNLVPGVSEIETYINLPQGEISGFEFNLHTSLDEFLPVDGLLVGFNYTWTDSEATLTDGRVVTLPGQAETVWNAIFGYDNGPWDLRAVVTERSDYLDEIRGDVTEDRFVLDHRQLDLSGRYSFTDHVQAFVEIKNITDEPYVAVTRPDGIDRLEQFEEYGWSTVMGFRFTY